MARIFIAYAWEYQLFAMQLARSLSDIGAEVWIDVESIPPGMQWHNAIQQGLETCEVLLLIVTPESMQSRNIEDEWFFFRNNQKPIIPIRYRLAPVHYLLQAYEYIDFENTEYTLAFWLLHRELLRWGFTLAPLPDRDGVAAPSKQSPLLPREQDRNPLINFIRAHLKEVMITLLVTMVSGVIVAWIIQADRFAPDLDLPSPTPPPFATTEIAQAVTDAPTLSSFQILQTTEAVDAAATQVALDLTAAQAQILTANAAGTAAQIDTTETAARGTLIASWTPTFTPSLTFTPTPDTTVTTTATIADSRTPTLTFTPDATVTALQATVDYWGTLAPTLITSPENRDSLGNAHVYPFYDNAVNFQDITVVELQLILYELAITPTPFGEVTLIPANINVERPEVRQDPGSQATPRPARVEENIQGLPAYIIAELECSESVFSGCGQQSVRNIHLQGTNDWIWRLQPIIERASRQSLSLVLYSANEIGVKQSNTPLWRHNFEIAVGSPSTLQTIIEQNLGAIISGIVAIIVALISGEYVLNKRRGETAKSKATNQPKVFISYSRKASAGFAQTLHDKLEAFEADVFIDVDDIHAGSFSEYIKEHIMKSDYFVVILAPDTLKSEWVVKEVKYAYEHNKTIIPILVNDFDLYGSEITDDLKFLQSFNAVELRPQFVDAAVEKIAKYIGLKVN